MTVIVYDCFVLKGLLHYLIVKVTQSLYKVCSGRSSVFDS